MIGAGEPPTRIVNMNHLGRVLTGPVDPPVKVLFVYNCNPLATAPHQNLRAAGPRARRPHDGRLRPGHDRHGALCRHRAAGDHVPRAVRFREGVRADQPPDGAARRRRGRRSPPERRCVRRTRNAARPGSSPTSLATNWR
ncbi:MAG: hypothetical protein M0C28_16270 [Candidatus Moduliflexus flocculans]|nr:hypothetical protein [Candidatus Moduliflexus flocculans]